MADTGYSLVRVDCTIDYKSTSGTYYSVMGMRESPSEIYLTNSEVSKTL
jgi:hypothetical protein